MMVFQGENYVISTRLMFIELFFGGPIHFYFPSNFTFYYGIILTYMKVETVINMLSILFYLSFQFFAIILENLKTNPTQHIIMSFYAQKEYGFAVT